MKCLVLKTGTKKMLNLKKKIKGEPEICKLSPKSDQSQFSPNKINTQSKENVVRINKMIT